MHHHRMESNKNVEYKQKNMSPKWENEKSNYYL